MDGTLHFASSEGRGLSVPRQPGPFSLSASRLCQAPQLPIKLQDAMGSAGTPGFYLEPTSGALRLPEWGWVEKDLRIFRRSGQN